MDILIYLLSTTVGLFLSLLMFAMFLRAVCSLFPIGDGALGGFLVMITEPFIFPVRKIFDHFGIGTNFPLDIPFFVTYLIISFISVMLP